MVRMKHRWPQEGDLVVATVHKVLNYGAFAKLEEYPEKKRSYTFLKCLQDGLRTLEIM